MNFNLKIKDLLSLLVIYFLMGFQLFWAVLVWYMLKQIPIQRLSIISRFASVTAIILIVGLLIFFFPFISVFGLTFSPLIPVLAFVLCSLDQKVTFKIRLGIFLCLVTVIRNLILSYNHYDAGYNILGPVVFFIFEILAELQLLTFLSELQILCGILIICKLCIIILGTDIILNDVLFATSDSLQSVAGSII